MNIISGGYTKRNSQGIYSSDYDPQLKQVGKPELIIKAANPTYLAVFDQTIISIIKDQEKGGIACYRFDGERYVKLSQYVEDQTPPAYVAVNPEHNLIFDANYHTGMINLYRLNPAGKIQLLDQYSNTGKGIKPEQDASHFHYVNLAPDGRLITCDLGTDEIILFDISQKKLTVSEKIKVNLGFGPRHLIFHPNGKYFYCVGELGSAVKVFTYGFEIRELASYPTIPASFTEHNGASAIKIAENGKNLYIANRGFNSIIVFEILNQGATLREIQNISTEGDFPRDFALNDQEKVLLVGNQNTDDGTLYQIEPKGTLKIIQKKISFHEPTFIQFQD